MRRKDTINTCFFGYPIPQLKAQQQRSNDRQRNWGVRRWGWVVDAAGTNRTKAACLFVFHTYPTSRPYFMSKNMNSIVEEDAATFNEKRPTKTMITNHKSMQSTATTLRELTPPLELTLPAPGTLQSQREYTYISDMCLSPYAQGLPRCCVFLRFHFVQFGRVGLMLCGVWIVDVLMFLSFDVSMIVLNDDVSKRLGPIRDAAQLYMPNRRSR